MVKVAVLMSGGVDSTMAALLLKEQGYDISGLTMNNWDAAAVESAAQAARYLGISHEIIDLRRLFYDRVVEYFYRSYEKGFTPNPCVECNRHIKFGALLDFALTQGFDQVATGHYSRIEPDESGKRFRLKKGIDPLKDQSYFLYGLNQYQLGRTLFPLGDLEKNRVLEMAREAGLKAADNLESQEICFIKNDYRDFIRDKVQYRPGEVVDRQGEILGSHLGLPFYTIGQRRGLGISAGQPIYVLELDMEGNRLVVGSEAELYHHSLLLGENNWIYQEEIDAPVKVEAKIRYARRVAPARLAKDDGADTDRMRLTFDSPQRAITCGQSAVCYYGEYVLGGGIILAVESH